MQEDEIKRLEEKYKELNIELKELTKMSQEINFTKLSKEESMKLIEQIREIEKDIIILKETTKNMQCQIENINENIEILLSTVRSLESIMGQNKTKESIRNWVYAIFFSGVISAIVAALMKLLLK